MYDITTYKSSVYKVIALSKSYIEYCVVVSEERLIIMALQGH